MKLRRLWVGWLVLRFVSLGSIGLHADPSTPVQPLHIHTLRHDRSVESYDEAVAVACLQGWLNRDAPRLYVLSRTNARPQYWLARPDSP